MASVINIYWVLSNRSKVTLAPWVQCNRIVLGSKAITPFFTSVSLVSCPAIRLKVMTSRTTTEV